MKKVLPIPVKSLKIGSYDVAVKTMGAEDKKANWGLYYCQEYEVHLLDKYPTRQKAGETALHEAIHVIWEERGLNEKDGEERIVTGLSRGIFSLLRDNPEFRDWLIKMAE